MKQDLFQGDVESDRDGSLHRKLHSGYVGKQRAGAARFDVLEIRETALYVNLVFRMSPHTFIPIT